MLQTNQQNNRPHHQRATGMPLPASVVMPNGSRKVKKTGSSAAAMAVTGNGSTASLAMNGRKRSVEPRPHPPQLLNKRYWDDVRAGRVRAPFSTEVGNQTEGKRKPTSPAAPLTMNNGRWNANGSSSPCSQSTAVVKEDSAGVANGRPATKRIATATPQQLVVEGSGKKVRIGGGTTTQSPAETAEYGGGAQLHHQHQFRIPSTAAALAPPFLPMNLHSLVHQPALGGFPLFPPPTLSHSSAGYPPLPPPLFRLFPAAFMPPPLPPLLLPPFPPATSTTATNAQSPVSLQFQQQQQGNHFLQPSPFFGESVGGGGLGMASPQLGAQCGLLLAGGGQQPTMPQAAQPSTLLSLFSEFLLQQQQQQQNQVMAAGGKQPSNANEESNGRLGNVISGQIIENEEDGLTVDNSAKSSDEQIDRMLDQMMRSREQQQQQKGSENDRRLCILPMPFLVPIPIPVSTDFVLKNFVDQQSKKR